MEHPDHRRIGRELGIFASHEVCGAGMPLWLPRGAAIRSELEQYIVELERRHGYQHVYTPDLAKRELFERSGHSDHYRDDMYPAMDIGAEELFLRPMSCPHHILVFETERPRIGDLPYRLAELATLFRYERSGVVSGLSRTRQMTLSDGHVFCLPEQVHDEIADILSMVDEAYTTLDIPPPRFRLSLRDDGDKFVDDDALWERSENALRHVLDDLDLDYTEAKGEAAFYAPKIDLQITDPQGREETLSTVQLDYHLPAQFGLSAERGTERVRPVMIHRSIISTMERMVAHLLEVHNGALPPWLSPNQVRLIPIEPVSVDYQHSVRDAFRRCGARVDTDDRNATLGARIRAAQTAKIPYIVVVGPNEAASGTVAIRLRNGEQLQPLGIDAAVDLVDQVLRSRSASLTP